MKKPSWLAVMAVSLTLLSLSVMPIQAYAFADAAVVAALNLIWNWAKTEMMHKMQNFEQSQTNQLTNKAESVFEKKAHWEKWPASLRELFVEQSVKLENQANQVSYKNAQDYLSYAQGTASGVDAGKYPAKAQYYFNKQYKSVQKMNPSCQLNVPQPVGYTSNNCSPAQQQFTNYLLTGDHPIPDYPKESTQTSDGQAYIQAKHVNETRIALAQVALDQATNEHTNAFIHYMQTTLKNPTINQINQESSAAVARDMLIIEKARAMIALKHYEATLMTQRLLATIVAQNEGAHLQRIRKLSKNIH